MNATRPYLQETLACGCIVEQPADKPSVFWRVAEPCRQPTHHRGDTYADDLRLRLLNKNRRRKS